MSVDQLLLRPTVLGHVLTIAHLDPAAVARFRARAALIVPDPYCRLDEDGSPCLIWNGARNSDGYGVVRVTPKGWGSVEMMTVHRLAFLLATGSLPREREIHHRCHYRGCFEPRHLAPVTGEENMADLTPLASPEDIARYGPEVPF